MASRAAIEGVAENGLQWRTHGPRIHDLCKRVGQFHDNNPANAHEFGEFMLVCKTISDRILAWSDKAEFMLGFGEQEALDWLANIAPSDAGDNGEEIEDVVEEAVACLNLLFDMFDFARVLVR